MDQAGVRRQPLEDATDPREKNLPGRLSAGFLAYCPSRTNGPEDFADRARKNPKRERCQKMLQPGYLFFHVYPSIIYYWNSKVIW